jgi:hypothetical protein
LGGDGGLQEMLLARAGQDGLDPELQELLASFEVQQGGTVHFRTNSNRGTGSTSPHGPALTVQGQSTASANGRVPGEGMWSSLQAPGVVVPLSTITSMYPPSSQDGVVTTSVPAGNAINTDSGNSMGNSGRHSTTTGDASRGEELYPGSAASYYATHGPRRRDRYVCVWHLHPLTASPSLGCWALLQQVQ